jgi:predicted transcriptional regulator
MLKKTAKKTGDLSDEAKNATIDRQDFNAAMKKLLQVKRPITKQEIAEKISRERHSSSHVVKR